MANDLNRVIQIGRLTREPELKQTPAGKDYCKFGIANNRTFKKGEEWEEKASFFNCIAWGTTAKIIAQYFQKGKRILIEGRLQSDTWEDKETGSKRTTIEIVVENFNFCDTSNVKDAAKAEIIPDNDNPFIDDDIPL